MTASARTGLLLLAICGVALALRVIGLKYGLPDVYNPDEIAIMTRALSFGQGTLNPHNFLYPTFYFYVLFAWVGVYLAFVWITGRVESLAALQRLFFSNPTGIYTAGRALGVAAGTATVLLVQRLGSRILDERIGFAAAMFLAVAPLHVRDSHYVKHDVPATLAIVVAYLAMTWLWPHPRPEGVRLRDTLIAGAACGAALSTHYYCVFLGVPLVMAIVLAWAPQGAGAVIRQLGWGIGAMLLMFVALSPFLLLEPQAAWRDITANRQIVVDRAVASGAFSPALRYLEMLWSESMGQPVTFLGIAGAVWMLFAAPGRAVFLLAFPVPFLLFIVNTAPASRYLNPVLPFLALFAASLLSAAINWRRSRPALFWIVTVLALVPGALASLKADFFLRTDDTRTLAERYVESEIPAGSTVLIQPHSVMLTPSRESLTEALTANLGSASAASAKFRLQLSLDPYPQPAYRLIYLGRGGLDADKIYVDPAAFSEQASLEPLRRLGVTFVVIKRYNKPDPETLPILAALEREARRMATFSPYRPDVTEAGQARVDPFLHNTDARIDDALERPGPRIEIWGLSNRF